MQERESQAEAMSGERRECGRDQSPASSAAITVARDGLRVLASDLDHPEAVCWDPGRGVVLAGGEAGELYSFDLDAGPVTALVSVGRGCFLGLAVDGDGRVYACDCARGLVLRLGPQKPVEVVASGLDYPNYLVFDAEGNLWVSASGDWGRPSGQIHRIAPDGGQIVLDTPRLAFANGLAIHEGHLYIVESAMARVVRVRLGATEIEEVIGLPRTVPDGLAFDAEGGLWISCFQPNRIYRLDSSGDLEAVVDDWSGEVVLTPTNVAFAGPDLRTLVIASIGGRVVRAIDAGIEGALLEYPSGLELPGIPDSA